MGMGVGTWQWWSGKNCVLYKDHKVEREGTTSCHKRQSCQVDSPTQFKSIWLSCFGAGQKEGMMMYSLRWKEETPLGKKEDFGFKTTLTL